MVPLPSKLAPHGPVSLRLSALAEVPAVAPLVFRVGVDFHLQIDYRCQPTSSAAVPRPRA